MGARGIASFDDDEGADFAALVLRSESIDIVEHALRVAATDEWDDLRHPDGMRALLAAELVASQRGYPSEQLSDQLQMWIEQFGDASDEMVQLARLAVDRVLRDSETRDLSSDSIHFGEWLSSTRDLAQRLQ